MTSSPRSARSLGARRAARLFVGLVALVAPLLAATAPASAYWSATGSGTGTATTGTLAAPLNVTVPETSIPDVPVSWTAGVNDELVEGYYVTRSQFLVNTDPVVVGVCSSDSTNLITTATSCTDTGVNDAGVADGRYTYQVIAVFRSWTASSLSAPVDVVGPAVLAFTSDVADTEPGSTILPPLTVALQTEAGTPYAWAGVEVTVSIGENPSAGALAGETMVNTDDEGVATFDTLSIDTAGSGYSLVASIPSLAPARSNAFDVNAPPLIGAASRYSVFGSGSVSNNDSGTSVAGDVGVSPQGTLSGLTADMVGGTIHVNDSDAALAHQAVSDNFDLLSSMVVPNGGLLSSDLSDLTLRPGVYGSPEALDLTGTLTLDGQVDPNGIFVIKSGGGLTTGLNSAVNLINGARAANVYWVIDGLVSLGTTSSLTGNILSSSPINFDPGAELIGRALSLDSVNLDNSTIRFARVVPTIAIDGGTTAITTDDTPTITGTSTAIPYSRVTVTIAYDTDPQQTFITTVRADGTWRVTAEWLGAWDWHVVAKVRETNGNTASASQVLTMEVNPGHVDLGPAATFSIVSRDSVTNSGETTVSGDVAVAVGTDITGFGPGMVDGATHSDDNTAGEAFFGAFDAQMALSQRPASRQIGGDIGGQIFRTGIYQSLTSVLSISGTVTLDANGDPDAVFIFQTPSLETAAGSQVILVNAAQASNVFWVTGNVTTGEYSTFSGNILSFGVVALGSHTTATGLVYGSQGVTLDTATLNGVSPAPAARTAVVPDASQTPVPGETPEPTPPPSGADTPVPSPTTTDTPTPEPASDQPSATESPTPSPSPSATATAAPSPSPTPEDPSPTASPTATKESSPTPSASSTGEGGTP